MLVNTVRGFFLDYIISFCFLILSIKDIFTPSISKEISCILSSITLICVILVPNKVSSLVTGNNLIILLKIGKDFLSKLFLFSKISDSNVLSTFLNINCI